ncbi:30S ribosomal protein S20 [candidate division WWE3 bacterium CG10_big_fil_rev_8_21_14_0_10_32_10]|uniref:Small ribosomal subunit protein bS20 n=1 Tax=candidate division WWE3 bacterium CG10_big_fil_rev_8_21_14_0_10_32_10 TaxID=1975090 RepID=A0A2H0R9M9_UNCKA|nr:MAG: 30S ribosomal protein S20 [candidate division WWE3 bacterium CG10_big_fil_rev_8_21_14_0_10_32_10]
MANTKSAKKQIRKIKSKTSVNRYWKVSIKDSVKKLNEAIEKKDKKGIMDLLGKSKSLIDKSAQRNVIHKNKARRMKSNLQQKVNKI